MEPGANPLTLAEVICHRGDPGSTAGVGSPLAAAHASLGIKPQDRKGEDGKRSESNVRPAGDDTVQRALSGCRTGGAGTWHRCAEISNGDGNGDGCSLDLLW